MRSYLTLHCLIRCCWVSEFAGPWSLGVSLMLSSAGCLLVTWSASCQPLGPYNCVPDRRVAPPPPPRMPYSYNILQCNLHAKQPTHCYEVSELYLHALVSNDSANDGAIFNAYLCFYSVIAAGRETFVILQSYIFPFSNSGFLGLFWYSPHTCVCVRTLCSFDLTLEKRH